MWFPVLVAVLPSTLIGLHLTSSIRPTMSKQTSIIRACARAIIVAATLSIVLYSLACGIMLLLGQGDTLDEMSTTVNSGVFSIVLVTGFVLAHALIRSVAAILFNSWNSPNNLDSRE